MPPIGSARAPRGAGGRPRQRRPRTGGGQDAYLAAVDGAQPAEALGFRRRASERLLQSGHFNRRALDVVGQVLVAIDDSWCPATHSRAVAPVRLPCGRPVCGFRRGLKFVERGLLPRCRRSS